MKKEIINSRVDAISFDTPAEMREYMEANGGIVECGQYKNDWMPVHPPSGGEYTSISGIKRALNRKNSSWATKESDPKKTIAYVIYTRKDGEKGFWACSKIEG